MADGGRDERDGGVDVVPDFLTEPLARLHEDLAVLLEVRHAALAPGELRALAREITALQGVLASAGFRTWAGMDARDDVVPKARPGEASVAFQRHALGIEHAVAARESRTAHLLDPDTGDLKTVGVAYAAGQVLRGHVDVAVRTHKDLGERVREELVPDGDGGVLRRIEAIDALLELESRRKSVREVDSLAKALVDALNPKSPEGAHERRYLHASQRRDGSVAGKFACGPTQGALILAVLAAGNAPRPGLAIDEHGVERVLPDLRDLGQRNIDALTDALAAGAARTGIPLPKEAGTRPDPEPWPDTLGRPVENDDDPEEHEPEPPAAEGEYTVVREPGVLSGPYPPVKILVTVGIEQLAAALTRNCGSAREPGGVWSFGTSPTAPPPESLAETVNRISGRAWIQHTGHPPDRTLADLFARARLQRVLHTKDGAVLSMGRAVRLATPAQKEALIARDVGCVIPGCGVPGERCEVHHVTPWAAGGPTDLSNLALFCSRHHTETGQGTWEIEMRDGVPWVRLPSWVDHTRPLLRNHTHCPRTGT